MRASDALLDALAAAEEAGDRLAVALDARLEVAEDAAPLFDAPAVEGRADVVLRTGSRWYEHGNRIWFIRETDV